MPGSQVVDHDIDQLGVLSSLTSDTGGIIDYDHAQGKCQGEQG
jgi:hypothetical protein